MTDRQKKFCEEYVRDRDPVRAYKAAYPHIRTDDAAHACASRMLRNAKYKAVQDYIAELVEKAVDESVADAREVLRYLTAVMRGEEPSETVETEGEEFKTVTRRDRIKAAELLAKYHQLLIPRVQVEAAQGGGVIVLAEATDGEP